MALSSDEYMVPGLYYMPRFKAELDRLFPNRLIVTHVVRFLFHPQNYYWHRITRTYHTYLAHHRRHLGLQVRSFYDNDTEVNPRILDCLVNVTSFLPPAIPREKLVGFLTKKHRKHHSFRSGRKSSVSVFVASLHAHHVEYLREVYRSGHPKDGSIIAFHQETADDQESHNNMAQYEAALIEIYLLSFSTDLVISEWSTFGAVAAALGGLKPWLFNFVVRGPLGLDWHGNGRVSCSQGTLETCFHSPPTNLDEMCPSSGAVRDTAREMMSTCWDGKGMQLLPKAYLDS
eukprot:TRINITY_DN1232_c0_g2_i1.p1 TRINITY_DN1232_c0_g2~~TRINITY_DN1232_c0_g2_i1.p1  ORF type:complete len:288 (+),score=40.21 TRINITY_DN1232_c0_g2_i1:159-1022(+)